MSDHHWPWSVLGIAPTEDRKAIREAYAPLLKALDPDAATEAFMTLRDARDAALSGHFLHPPHEEGMEEEDDFGLGTPLPEGSAPPAEPQPDPDPEPAEKPQFTVEYSDEDDQRFQRMVELFLGENALATDELAELDANLDALLADDRMADLGHYARVEAWLAQLLADRYPRGAALFPRVAEHFQWAERAHELGIHPAIPWLFGAHEGYSRLREIETPGHTHHREWNELKRGKPTGPLWLRSVDKTRMANLINTIRRDYPWLEAEHWQPELVARWEKKVEGGGVSGPNLWIWLVFAAIFFAAVPRMFEAGPMSASEAALVAQNETKAADNAIAAFLERNFPDAAGEGRTVETLKTNSPEIYDKLRRDIELLPASQKYADAALMKKLTDGYFTAIDKLPFDRQLADARFRVEALKTLRKDPQGCLEFLAHPARYMRSGNAPIVLTEQYRSHIFAVVHDDYADVANIVPPNEFTLPGELVGRVINRSGLSEARVRAAISSRDASDADVCLVRGSLLELLTEIPRKQSEKILPVLL